MSSNSKAISSAAINGNTVVAMLTHGKIFVFSNETGNIRLMPSPPVKMVAGQVVPNACVDITITAINGGMTANIIAMMEDSTVFQLSLRSMEWSRLFQFDEPTGKMNYVP